MKIQTQIFDRLNISFPLRIIIYRQMSHTESVSFKIFCNCQSRGQLYKDLNEQINLQELQRRFGKTLEEEARKQHEQNAFLIDDLNNQIFVLKNTISKLQLRNKRDSDSEKQLRKQYSRLLQKMKETQIKVIREVEVVQRIKQVPIQINLGEFEGQIKHLKEQFDLANRQVCKIQMDKNLVQVQNQKLKDQIESLYKLIGKFKNQIEEFKAKCNQKDRIIEKLNEQNSFLKTNKEIVVQTKHLFPEFVCPEKTKIQTKYQTIYVEKPVQKIVFIEVQKRVKQFIQPERPLVNRIIRCEQNTTYKSEKEEERNDHYQQYRDEIQYLTNNLDLLQNNVAQYKSQRQRLIDVIQNKNSELNHLQTRIKLMGCDFSTPTPFNLNKQSGINVRVTKLKNEEKQIPISYKAPVQKNPKQSKRKL